MEHRFEAPVWRYAGAAGWWFVTLPLEVAEDIAATAEAGGFGSVRVSAQIGSTNWATSIFPSKADASYLLPLKAAVRAAEQLGDGDVVTVCLVIPGRRIMLPAKKKRTSRT